MRIIKKEAFLAAFWLTSLLLPANSYADPAEACPPPVSCAPCGSMMANVSNIPAYANGVNPLTNFTATAETVRCRGYFSGFYLGAAYGLGNINYHLELAGSSPFEIDNDARSYFVTVFNGGFNLVLDYFFLGVQVGYNYRSRNNPISYFDAVDFLQTNVLDGVPPVVISQATSAPCKIRVDINSQHAGTADLLPGFVYSRFVAYLRIGAEQTQYDYQRRVCFPLVELDNNTENLAIIRSEEFIDSRKKTATGYRLGAGFGVAAGPHISFHLNYIHTFGQKLNFHHDVSAIAALSPVVDAGGTNVVIGGLGELAADTTVDPERDEVTFGVMFRF